MHKYFTRDALSGDTGPQGPIEIVLIFAAFALILLVANREPKSRRLSDILTSFAIVGIFALLSSARSYWPLLSVAKGFLLLVVLSLGYFVIVSRTTSRFLSALYYNWVLLLLSGLLIGMLLPERYQLIQSDEFTGRTRFSVFATFPGTLGELSAIFLLIGRVLPSPAPWYCQVFLFGVNLAAGGKVSTACLIAILLALSIARPNGFPRQRITVMLIGMSCILTFVIWVSSFGSRKLERFVERSTESVYGNDVAAEAVTLDGRLQLWAEGLSLLDKCVFLGYGFDGAREAFVKTAEWSGHSHNGMLEVTISAGFLGLVAFLYGWYLSIRYCLKMHGFVQMQLLSIHVFIFAIGLLGPVFSFPSYFVMLILGLLPDLVRPELSNDSSSYSQMSKTRAKVLISQIRTTQRSSGFQEQATRPTP